MTRTTTTTAGFDATNDPRNDINWPEAYKPETAPLYARNELVIPAPPATVWAWLTYAKSWPEWYPNAQDVEFTIWPGPYLRAGSEFRWSTFGFRLTSTVHDYEKERRLAWVAKADGVLAYHTWYLHPLDDGTTLLITDETQISTLGIWSTDVFTKGLVEQHDVWLRQLSKKAQTGLPPA
ncbi:SRPBCC family protein [Massilia aurea]|uniref:SRPBCC family protein n=1 Tax=Massilia aurea TaxID=373040 RepID=UPI000F2DE770|nr:SRPBCC family protein [Massilia aurea]